jgi:hypothetical protein
MNKDEFKVNQIVTNYFGNEDYIVKNIVKDGIWFERVLHRYEIILYEKKQENQESFLLYNKDLSEFKTTKGGVSYLEYHRIHNTAFW